MTSGVSLYSGNEATTAKASFMFRNWFAMPMRTWPFVKAGEPLA